MNKELIHKLNQSPTKVFIAATGGGSSFIGDYLQIPGGSKTILGFYVPYAQPLFDEFIGGKPDKYVSSAAARKLAVASYDKARKLGGNLGVGVSCSLTTGAGEREGRENWVHIAVHGSNFTSIYDTRVDGIFSTREAQEIFVAQIMLEILAYESGFSPEFGKWEGECYERHECKSSAVGVMNYEFPSLIFGNDNPVCADLLKNGYCVLGGSFNPHHEAHDKMAELAAEITGLPVVLEFCTKNVDKAGLDYLDLKTRLEPIKDKYPVIVTNTPLIIDKIALLNEKRFNNDRIVVVMGKDTWNRFLHPNYDKDIQSIVARLEWFNVEFLVFGRNGDTFDRHHPAEKWRIKDSRAENFDVKVSSSAIRAGQMGKL